MMYAFELGRKKELCFAELISLFGEDTLVERNLDTAIFSLPEKSDLTSLQNRLGGTVKIIEVLLELPLSSGKDLSKSLRSPLPELLTREFSGHSGKILFSISTLGFMDQREVNIKELLIFSKKFLKSLNLSSRFVNKDFRSPKPSTIYKARVIEKGLDLNIIKGKNKIFLGKSVTIQNIDNYSKRDYGKPGRDARVGMLPPKLAQILINLAGPHTKTVYDPFCGSGSILIETLLMGKTAIGSDLDQRMTEFSEMNCKWLKENFHIDTDFRVFQKDAQHLSKDDLPERIEAIVTEGYLGPAISRFPDPKKRNDIFTEVSQINANFLNNIHPFLPKTVKIVLCLPAFKDRHNIEFLPDFEKIAKISGFKIAKSLIYDRPDQLVAREIKILEKI